MASVEEIKESRNRRKYTGELTDDPIGRERELARKLCKLDDLLYNEESANYVTDEEKRENGRNNLVKWIQEYERIVESLFAAGNLRRDRICRCGAIILLPWRDLCGACITGSPRSVYWESDYHYYYLIKKRTGMYSAVMKSKSGGKEYSIPGCIDTPDKNTATVWLSKMAGNNGWKPVENRAEIEQESASGLEMEFIVK